MAEAEKTQEIMPWQQNWTPKPIQAISSAAQAVEEGVGGALEAIKSGKMPWDMSWKAKKAVEAVKPSQPITQDASAYANERAMKKTAVIHPSERQPDTQSVESNIAEIDKELARAKNKSIIAILNAEKEKLMRSEK